MAEELLETVEKLQSRLSEAAEPRKLLKTLRRLGELPMTVDILVETGVGKTVNSFRKHELAGEAAKTLVAKWKKLVPQSSDRPSSSSHSKETPRSHAHPRGHEDGVQAVHKRQRVPSPQEEEPAYMEHDEEMMMIEERGYSTSYSPSPPQHQDYSPQRRGGYQSDEYGSPSPSPPPPPPPPPPPAPPTRKEIRHAKPHKEPSKNHGDRGGGEGKKRRADPELQPGSVHKSSKHSSSSTMQEGKKEKEREEKKKGGSDGRPRAPMEALAEEDDFFEAPTMSFESFLTYDAPAPIKKKKKHSSSSSSTSYSRPPHPSLSASSSSANHTRAPQSSSSSSSKASRPNGTKSSRRLEVDPVLEAAAAAPVPERRRRQVVEAVPILPDIALPAIQPNYRPLPSIDPTPLSPQRRKVPVSNDEEDAGFTGKRFNSKMVVYSGSKTAFLPKMMTLYEQCIRVLQNNIDSIDEVGGVPFEILEPVLERCTPEQLNRIEQCNQWFMEDSDELWMRHCRRDFRRETPQEYESWREMYLRLHDEREERLRLLTQNISSAHANKPKGRQVKMAFVNSAVKPPRDVRRRQERFGTSSGSQMAGATPAASAIKIRPAISYGSHSSEAGRSSSSLFSPSSPPHASSRPSVPGGGGAGPAGRDKPQVKKIAPMMAKTIKAFRNRFSRR